jgi:hypothetical protein
MPDPDPSPPATDHCWTLEVRAAEAGPLPPQPPSTEDRMRQADELVNLWFAANALKEYAVTRLQDFEAASAVRNLQGQLRRELVDLLTKKDNPK